MEVAAPQVSLHIDRNGVPPGSLLHFSTSVTLRLSWELLTGRYGEESGGGGGGARLVRATFANVQAAVVDVFATFIDMQVVCRDMQVVCRCFPDPLKIPTRKAKP